jgi:hypothetical protein
MNDGVYFNVMISFYKKNALEAFLFCVLKIFVIVIDMCNTYLHQVSRQKVGYYN